MPPAGPRPRSHLLHHRCHAASRLALPEPPCTYEREREREREREGVGEIEGKRVRETEIDAEGEAWWLERI
jgi:hypothetical protein